MQAGPLLPTTPGGNIAHELAAMKTASPSAGSPSPLTVSNLKEQNGHYRAHECQFEQKKRKYSAGLFNYTKSQWEGFRHDIERRSSASSSHSSENSVLTSAYSNPRVAPQPSESSDSPNSESDATGEVGSVPALH